MQTVKQSHAEVALNQFGVWFWEDFYSIDAKKVSKSVDFSTYTNIYKDFEKAKG